MEKNTTNSSYDQQYLLVWSIFSLFWTPSFVVVCWLKSVTATAKHKKLHIISPSCKHVLCLQLNFFQKRQKVPHGKEQGETTDTKPQAYKRIDYMSVL